MPLRIGVGIFVALLILFVLRLLFIPFTPWHNSAMPFVEGMALAYAWHLVVLPATFLAMGINALVQFLIRRYRPARPVLAPTLPPHGQALGAPTRRDVLASAAVFLPPLVAAGGLGVAVEELGQFRIRPMTIGLKSLPPALDGLTIAHVTDTHIGRFTNDAMLKNIAERTNALDADLVLFTGDLIDIALADLPVGIAFAKSLRSRFGTYFCEGNHDLAQDFSEKTMRFRAMTKAAGLSLLADESVALSIRGEPVQILGSAWSRTTAERKLHGNWIMQQVDPSAFNILLTHHPHMWDYTSIPLTLAGHTHGGQLMLNEKVGVGAVMFRYWTGLYRDGDRALVVSNGVGNWFPVRIHAPAEIVHITLRSTRTVAYG